MGGGLSRRISSQDSLVHVIGRFDQLVSAEATAYMTPLVGKTLRESNLRSGFGINVVGIWERGTLLMPDPDTVIHEESVLLIAGSVEQLRSEEHTSELQSRFDLVCRLLLEKKKRS